MASVSPTSQVCERCGRELPAEGAGRFCYVCALKHSLHEPPPEAALPLDLDDLPLSAGPLPELPGYELLDRIGRGGMGVVYRARQTRLGRVVAVKLLGLEAVADESARRRFQMEAHAVARLQHPGIVPVIDAGSHAGQPYLVMEYVAGGDLAQAAAGKPLDPTRAAHLVQRAAEALQFAHEHGVLHRDVKPSNILLEPDDQPRLTDFGLAKRLDADPRITLPGQTLGSPGYLPPEQAAANRGAPGPASDVYGLGAVLYYLLTGRPPFLASTLADTLHEVLHKGPVGLRELNPSVPETLETICLKCLEKRPGDRYDSAAELAADLGRFLDRKPILARRPWLLMRGWRQARLRPTASALAGAVLLIGLGAGIGGIWFGWRAQEESRAAKAAQQALERRRLVKEDALRQNAAALYASRITGAYLAWQQGDAWQAWEDLNACRERDPGWEYDYLQNLFTRSQRIFRGHAGMVATVAFSPDGKWLASGGGDGALALVEVATGTTVWSLQLEQGGLSRVAFLPSGGQLVASSVTGFLTLINRETGTRNAEQPLDHTRLTDFALQPDGQRVALAMQTEGVQVWDFTKRARLAEFREPLTRVVSVAIDAKGRLLASSGRDGSVVVRDLADGQVRWQIKAHDGPALKVAFNLQTDQLLSAGADGWLRVWSAADGTPMRSFRASERPLRDAIFSPDGQTIVTTGADACIKFWKADSSAPVLVLRGHTAAVACLAVSADGRFLASGGRDRTVRLWDLAVASRSPILSVHQGATRSLAVSADGSQYLSLGDDGRLVLGSLTDWSRRDTLQRADAKVTAMAFCPTGQKAVVGTAQGTIKLWAWESGGVPRLAQTWTNHVGAIRCFVWSEDGQRLATAGDDGKLYVRDVTSAGLVMTLAGHTDRVSHLVFCRDGIRLASAGEDRLVRIWNTQTGHERVGQRNRQPEFLDLRDTPQGLLMASQGVDRSVWIECLDGQGGAYKLAGDELPGLRRARVSKDGRRLFAVGERTVFVWDAQTHRLLLTLSDHPAILTDLALSDDERILLVGDAQGRVEILDGTPKPVEAVAIPEPQPPASAEGAEARPRAASREGPASKD